MPYFWRYKRPSILIPACPPPPPLSPSLISLMVSEDVKHHVYLLNPRMNRPHRNLRTVCPLLQSLCQVCRSVSRSVSKSVFKSVSKSPSQSFSFVQLVVWLNLIHIQQVGLTIFYLPSSWLMFYCCLIVVVVMVWSCRKIWRRWCFIIFHVRLND